MCEKEKYQFIFVLAVFATPFVTSLILLCLLFFIQGIGHGLTDLSKDRLSVEVLVENRRICFDIGGTNILLTMWGDNAAAPMNLVRLGYGLGAIFVNLLVRPFLTKNISPIASTLASNTVIETEANIFIPYSITAALCVLIAVPHLCFYIRALKSEREKLEVRQVMKNQKGKPYMKLSLTF